jgi:hypothetical protein
VSQLIYRTHETGVSVFKTIDRRALGHFSWAALIVMLGLGCAQNRNMAEAPEGQFGNGQETLDYVAGLGFTADSAYVGSYNCTQCQPQRLVKLMFLPLDRAENVQWQKHLRPKEEGHVVAQIKNFDNAKFVDLNLDTGEVAYAWVGEIKYNDAPMRGFAIYKLNKQGFVDGQWYTTPLGKIEFCKNSAKRSKPAIKDKHDAMAAGSSACGPMTLASLAENTRLASFGASVAYAAAARSASTLFAIGKLWISCAGGCCQVSPD